ncbi:MAG: GntR family transcriptional regulator [Candidatus Izemoplasmatales bacterium]|jgi:GntR family transcriptional regulator|nr:GntR family transcriptional regulator [Candidatus Izemoplasmatales bacterium]
MYNEMRYLHEQIYEDIKNKILTKEYIYGSMLPREIDLMSIYKVSRHTIRKAMDRLFVEGYVYKVKGTGTFVKSSKADYKLSKMSSFSEIIDNQNGKPNSVVIEAKKIQADEKIKEKLDLGNTTDCYYIERIRRNGKTNLCFEKTYINPQLCPDIIEYITPNTSLYQLYETRYNLSLFEGTYDLEAITASKHISKILDISEGSAILYMEANIFVQSGVALYFVEAYYIGSRYTFSTNLKR